jgi:hypothetical protein
LAVSKNDNEAIECAPHGFAKAAFQDTLATLPIVTYEVGETVIADGSRTGRLLILKNGTVTISAAALHCGTLARTSAFEVRLRIKAERTEHVRCCHVPI